MIAETPPKPTDESLFVAYRDGDREAGDTLVRRYNRKLIGYLINSFRLSQSDAEDVTQQTWLSVFGYLQRNANVLIFSAWLFASARNEAIRYLKSPWLSLASTGNSQIVEDLPDSDPSSEEELHCSLVEIVASLPDDHRKAISLIYWQGYSVNDVADILGVCSRTVKRFTRKAKKEIRQNIL